MLAGLTSRPLLTNAVEALTAAVLRRKGIRSVRVPTRLGRVHAFAGPGAGPLPPIVLIHGLGASAASFAPVLLRAQRHARRVIALDLPGHGFSDAPDRAPDPDALAEAAAEALCALHGEPAVVCGNSLGGLVALRYAARHPGRVRALALLSPGAAPMDDDEVAEVRRAFHMPTDAEARAFLARLYHRMPPVARLFARDTHARMMGPVVQGILGSIQPAHAVTPDLVRGLEMPVLFVWGRSERLLPPSGLAFFREHLPRHARVEEPELGHCPHMDDPRWVADALVDLARRAGESGPHAP